MIPLCGLENTLVGRTFSKLSPECAQLTSIRSSALAECLKHERRSSVRKANVGDPVCHLWRETGRELQFSGGTDQKNTASRSPSASANAFGCS